MSHNIAAVHSDEFIGASLLPSRTVSQLDYNYILGSGGKRVVMADVMGWDSGFEFSGGPDAFERTRGAVVRTRHRVRSIDIAPFELSRLLFPLLEASGRASVINIASIAATVDVRTGPPYTMSKAGLIQQSRSLAVEWGRHNIRVNTVAPGQIPLSYKVVLPAYSDSLAYDLPPGI